MKHTTGGDTKVYTLKLNEKKAFMERAIAIDSGRPVFGTVRGGVGPISNRIWQYYDRFENRPCIWQKMNKVDLNPEIDALNPARAELDRLTRQLFEYRGIRQLGEITAADLFNLNNDRFDYVAPSLCIGNISNFFFTGHNAIGLDPFSPRSGAGLITKMVAAYSEPSRCFLGFLRDYNLNDANSATKFLFAIETQLLALFVTFGNDRLDPNSVFRIFKDNVYFKDIPSKAVYDTRRTSNSSYLFFFEDEHKRKFHEGFGAGVRNLKTYLQQKEAKPGGLPPGIVSRIEFLGWKTPRTTFSASKWKP